MPSRGTVHAFLASRRFLLYTDACWLSLRIKAAQARALIDPLGRHALVLSSNLLACQPYGPLFHATPSVSCPYELIGSTCVLLDLRNVVPVEQRCKHRYTLESIPCSGIHNSWFSALGCRNPAPVVRVQTCGGTHTLSGNMEWVPSAPMAPRWSRTQGTSFERCELLVISFQHSQD